MTQSDQEEPGGRFDFMWPLDPAVLRETTEVLRTGKDGPKVRVTVELDARTAAILMLTGKGWMQRFRRLEAAAWGRPVEPWTDADILPFEVARVANFEAANAARRWEENPWVAMMRAASGADGESGE